MTATSRDEGAPAATLRARDRVLPLGARTYVMAILNLTDDSFSGDGVGDDLDEAVRRAVAAAADGADIIDVGGESARADVPVRDEREEADAVGAAVRRIAREVDALLSVDTYKRAVAEAGLQAGAAMVNDISGLIGEAPAAAVAAKYGAALVINYTYERPKVRPSERPRYDDVVAEHIRFLRDRMRVAAGAGVADDAIVLDPGIAFGKSHDEDLEVLRRLPEFRALGRPLLVAASRKHFIGSAAGLPPRERDEATAAVTALAVAGGADIVRVHDVRANVRAARIADAVVRGRPGDYAPDAASWPWGVGVTPEPGTTIGSDQD
jgi:dihydropteroate synthase